MARYVTLGLRYYWEGALEKYEDTKWDGRERKRSDCETEKRKANNRK